MAWVLRGGWKWIGGALLIAGIYWWGSSWLADYHHMKERAAAADVAEAKLIDREKRLEWVKGQWRQNKHDADVARAELRAADENRRAFFSALGRPKNEAVETDPRCLPHDDDRRVRNEAWDRYIPGFGRNGVGSSLPAVP